MNKLDTLFLNRFYFDDQAKLRQARILRNAILLTSLFSGSYVFTCLLIDFHMGTYFMVFNFVFFLFLPLLLRTTLPIWVTANLYILVGTVCINGVIYFSGGLMSSIMPWLAATPAVAMLVTQRKTSLFWLALNLILALFYTYLYYNKLLPEPGYNMTFGNVTFLFSSCMIGLIAIIYVINYVFESAKSKALMEVEAKNKEISEINTELKAQKEEIESQRDTIEEKSQILESVNEEISLKNRIIEKKNEDTLASINYASRIQQAMLPPEEQVCRIMGNCFIVHKARDIVSGDFYWFAEVKGRKIIAAIDCTGHGVPGALMSMIGNNLLNEIVIGRGIVMPNRILEELDKGIIDTLKQKFTSNRDGMDIALCAIYEEEGKFIVEYAGAKNPLIVVKDGKFEKFKADKSSIGGEKTSDKIKIDKTFNTQKITVEKESMCYIFSDGYQDQFGGENDTKFMSKNMYQLFEQISQKSAEKQKEILEQTFDQWKGKSEQIDDVLIIGFRVG